LSSHRRGHVFDAYDILRFTDHPLQSFNRLRDNHDGELTVHYLDEINPIAWSQTERSPYLSRDCDLAF
jgi:hypothetical protein